MQVEAFKRGDMDALGEAVDLALPTVWRLVRRGFLTERDGLTTHLRGVGSRDVTETLTIRIIANCLTVPRRQATTDQAAFEKGLLEETLAVLWTHGERAGGLVTLEDEEGRALVPEHVQSIDALIAGTATLDEEPPATDVEEEQTCEALSEICRTGLAEADERTQTLARMRFVEGKTRREVAAHFTCGHAAISAQERRLRINMKNRIRKEAEGEPRVGHATLDALLSGAPLAEAPPFATRERLRREVLTRTFVEEPAPYGQRLAWGLGALAVAMGLWALMFMRVLPYYEDDKHPTPRVEVQASGPGSEATIRVLAPRDSVRVAVALQEEGKKAVPLLVSPTGRSIRLPFGSHDKTVDIAYRPTLPSDVGPSAVVVAHFSEDRLTLPQILALTEGRTNIEGVLTTSTALSMR